MVSAEEHMNREKHNIVGSLLFALTFIGAALGQAPAQDAKTPHSSIAPIEQYLMDREAEIALARTAAPESVSRDATVLVLGRHGYETAVDGTNGFVCLVERSWMGPLESINFSTKN